MDVLTLRIDISDETIDKGSAEKYAAGLVANDAKVYPGAGISNRYVYREDSM